MIGFTERRKVQISLIVLGGLFAVIAALTDSAPGGADNYAHYNIARWAFRYPHLFLDHWGKPLFTILIAPFTQFGFLGAKLFNIVVGLTTAWLCYLLGVNLRIDKAWLAPVFVIFAPMYFVLMFSGMTEILFSFVLVLSVFLFFREKYIWAAIAISFIILVRSEGFIFLPLFLLVLALKRKYFAVPFLGFGFLVFSLIGYFFHYHNFWWLITKLPYVDALNGIYGSGTWHHFLSKMPEYLDFFILIFFLLGMVFWMRDWIRNSFSYISDGFYQLILVSGCFWIYLLAHSYVWWRGEMSLGLIRVMAGVTPLAGIIALVGWNEVEKLLSSSKIKIGFLGLTVLLISIPGILRYKSEFKTDPHNVVINRVIKWLHETDNFRHHLIVHDPYIAFASGVDAWDHQRLQYGFSDVNAPEKSMPDSSVFIWDAHFSQNEGRMPASHILENPYYELIGYFEPEVPFKVLNGYDYNVMVFRKVANRKRDNLTILEELRGKLKESGIIYSEYFDFENPIPEKVNENFRKEAGDSVANSLFQMGPECEFGPNVILNSSKLEISNRLRFAVEFDFRNDETLLANEMMMICSVEKDGKSYFYQGSDIFPFLKDQGKWNRVSMQFSMPEKIEKETYIKLYVWNIKKKSLAIDNYKVQVFK